MMVLHGLKYRTRYQVWNKNGGMGYGICWWYGIIGKIPCGSLCVDGIIRGKHSIWYSTFSVWYYGTVSSMYYMAKFAWGYGMCQYSIRSVRVEHVV